MQSGDQGARKAAGRVSPNEQAGYFSKNLKKSKKGVWLRSA